MREDFKREYRAARRLSKKNGTPYAVYLDTISGRLNVSPVAWLTRDYYRVLIVAGETP